MNQLFNPDGPIIQFITRLFDLIVLNIIFLILSIPIITTGASVTALYYVLLKVFRGEEPYILRNFFKAFRQNFRQSTIIWLILLAAAGFLAMDLHIAGFWDTTLFKCIRLVLWMVCGVFLGIFLYIFPIVSHFVCSTKQAFKNAALMMFMNLPYTLVMFAVSGAVFYLFTASFQTFVWVVTVGGVCGFSVLSFLFCILFDRVFRKYEPEDEVF